jgi:lysozyme
MMQLGPKGHKLIQSFEQFRGRAYKDQGGIWTCGWGHTGPDVVQDTTCTEWQATHWFDLDTGAAVAAINRTTDVPLTQNQFDALAAFTFNAGVTAEGHSTLIKYVNSRNFSAAADEFLRWNHVKGVVSVGLTRRREAERALFLDTSI